MGGGLAYHGLLKCPTRVVSPQLSSPSYTISSDPVFAVVSELAAGPSLILYSLSLSTLTSA